MAWLASDSSLPDCDEADSRLEKWTGVRYAVLCILTFVRALRLRSAGRDAKATTRKPFCHHPNLTKRLQEGSSSNPILVAIQMIWALVIWVQEEGVGPTLYFGTSACMDNVAIFVVPHEAYCEVSTLVALYSAALISFLPNILISWKLQGPWYSNGQWFQDGCYKIRFVALILLTTITCFIARLFTVYHSGWIDLVSSTLYDFKWKVEVAAVVPPMVDFLQILFLSLAGAKATEDDCDEAYEVVSDTGTPKSSPRDSAPGPREAGQGDQASLAAILGIGGRGCCGRPGERRAMDVKA
eukprot:gnl/TRDRNA2_/TRDRNA2_169128_c3_seq1.p1 gnl/TRDRNA2_/TRDRNA2_169128_c3~~gnl/TRDRNA2_/TRDRNA2_169128_c3_seq1.p1  ORF type:complete len:297 (-),score=9.69 gnl/TRDRNA2_/TRDRNA2_169128_c3_seq1:71-961(-)